MWSHVSQRRESPNSLRELRDDEIVAPADATLQLRRGQRGEVINAHPVPLRAVRRLNDALDVREIVEFLRGALKDDAVDRVAIERDDQKHFSRHFMDEALAPLLDPRGLRERKRKLAECGKAHG
jgi:hypothetical protein